MGGVLQPSDHFCGLLWTRCDSSMSFLCWGLQSWMQDSRWSLTRAEQRDRIPSLALLAMLLLMQPRIQLAFWATLVAHVKFFIHQYPQVLLGRAALNPFIPQPVFVLGIVLTHVQDLALGLVEPHEVHTGPLLELVQVPLDGIPSFWCVSCTIQLGVICKLAEGALDLAVCVIDENVKEHRSQYRPLRDTTHHWHPLGHSAIDHYPLAATFQPIP